jgi:hypothetical protein
VRSAREEHPVDRTADLLQPGARLRSGEDDHVPGRHADHQVPRHRLLQVVPERAGQQQAGLEPVEGQHQGRWLAVDADPVQAGVQVLGRLPAQVSPHQAEAAELVPREQALPVRRAGGVGDGEVTEEPIGEVGGRDLLVVGAG